MSLSLVAAALLGLAVPSFQAKSAPAPAPAPAPKPAGARLEWQHDWKSACERATEQKKPILVFLLSDGEPICQKTLDGIVADAEGMRRLANFVVVVASPSQHELVEKEIDGKRVKSCARYPGILCSEHVALELALRDQFLDKSTGGEVIPQFAAFDGNGALLLKHAYAMKRDGFLEFLNAALAAGGGTAVPAEATRSPAVLKIIEAVVGAKDDDEREKAARELFADSSPEREAALQEILARLKKPADQGVVIRAAGAPEAKAWAPAIALLLADKSSFVRDCAVVTLEEERNPAVAGDLLAAWTVEKDEDVKKDLLRALGPCGTGKAEAKRLLIAELGSSREQHRIAAAVGLGALLPGNADVASAMQSHWSKGNHELRIALIWGVGEAGDATQAELVDRLMKGQTDPELTTVANVAKERLRSNLKKAVKSMGKGGGQQLERLLAPVYGADKVPRNFLRALEEHGKK
ncbi:MAG TPA: hypothetical protein VFG37_11065 [Planctomycetota bacterium]|jgi:HEAT repeat protein|nr:hypothetical protein [Planctomycetota bacterium]